MMNLVNKMEQDGQKYLENEKKENSQMKQLGKFLADPSVNPNVQGKFCLTALIRAVQVENMAVVESIHACHLVDANPVDDNGYTPLIWPADQGSVGSVRLDTPHSVAVRHGPLQDSQEAFAG